MMKTGRPPRPESLIPATCLHCGKLFHDRRQGNRTRKYCSRRCANLGLPGDRTFKDVNGYVIYCRDGLRIMQHRYVMKQMLGRKLKSHETVHHKNGVRDDNGPESLELWRGNHGRGQRAADLPEEDIWSGMIPRYQIDAEVS